MVSPHEPGSDGETEQVHVHVAGGGRRRGAVGSAKSTRVGDSQCGRIQIGARVPILVLHDSADKRFAAGALQQTVVLKAQLELADEQFSDESFETQFRLPTHGDFEDMKSFGAYNFYRVGITPQGRWRFFVAGD